jgi:hypothetical protein
MHYGNSKLNLTGQKIFPNWIKTLKVYGSSVVLASQAFQETFLCGSAKSDDTAEPAFEDGTPLSSIGEPNNARNTYKNRTGITPQNNGNNYWK